MATESPAIHDGSQCTAAANYGLSQSLAGPNGSGQFLGVYISASRTVTIDATGGVAIYGILQNTPGQGQAADVVISGISKAVAGAAVSANDPLMTDSSGRVITATSTNHRFATAIESASGAGQIITVLVHGSNRTVA
jgi:hypothetical protein